MTQETTIAIQYSEDMEMMEISKGSECIFYGSYNDFDYEPKALQEFLTKAGLTVIVEEVEEL